MKKIVLITGGFDPLHSGHLNLIKHSRKLGDILIAAVNSDAWLRRKKGQAFLTCWERVNILNNIKGIDQVITFDDTDDTACDAIVKVKAMYPYKHQLIFANGGDRTSSNIPEMIFNDVDFQFGIGGEEKVNSSSLILQEWKAPKTIRPWGHYSVLHHPDSKTKVKELTVQPGQRLSMQRHKHRAEHWFITQGEATVYNIDRKSDLNLVGRFTAWHHIHILTNEWHQLCNETHQELKLVEIQYGDTCDEADIERKQ